MSETQSRVNLDGVEVQRWVPQASQTDLELPAILIIHGAMDRSATFMRTRRRLAHRDVTVYDRRGYGRSVEANPIHTLRDHVDDIFSILDWMNADEVLLVGHSLGGYLALVAASLGDPRIVGVNLYEAPATELTGDHEQVGGGAVEVAAHGTDEDGAEAFYKMMIGERMWDRLRDSDRQARRSEGTVLMREFADLRAGNTLVAWDDISQPVTIGFGAESPHRFTTAATKIFQRLTRQPAPELQPGDVHSDRHLVSGEPIRIKKIANTSHGIHLTHPGEYAQFIEC